LYLHACSAQAKAVLEVIRSMHNNLGISSLMFAITTVGVTYFADTLCYLRMPLTKSVYKKDWGSNKPMQAT
jgi:hypothetical protein